MIRRGSGAISSNGIGSILGTQPPDRPRAGPAGSLARRRRHCTVPLVPIDPSSVLLTDRVAVVTGGGSGIGRGIARGFAAFGAKVAIWERHADTAAAAAAEVGGPVSTPTSATRRRWTPRWSGPSPSSDP